MIYINRSSKSGLSFERTEEESWAVGSHLAKMAAPSLDKYRDYLSEEEVKSTKWRFGPPNYDAVNKLFEEDRTKVRIRIFVTI